MIMIIESAVAFLWLYCILMAQAATVSYNKVTMDSVVIEGSGTTATVTGALAITGTATATGLQINGVVDVTGTLTASTHPVMPRRWVQKQATSSWMSSGAYSNITGLTHSFTALANRVYGIHCDAEVQGTTNTSFPKVDVSVWDGATMLSSRGNAFVSAGVSNEQFVALSSSWIGTLTAGSHTIQCKYYFPIPRPWLPLKQNWRCEVEVGKGTQLSSTDCAQQCNNYDYYAFWSGGRNPGYCLCHPTCDAGGQTNIAGGYKNIVYWKTPVLKMSNSSTLRIMETVDGGILN